MINELLLVNNFWNSGFVFLMGLCFGSFVNCLSWRLENPRPHRKAKRGGQGEKIKEGKSKLRHYNIFLTPSFCDSCSRGLKWWENIPVFSWIFLKGKCRTCHSPVPYQYPVIELLTGVIFLGIYRELGTFKQAPFDSAQGELIFWWLVVVVLMIVLSSDWWYGIIPDVVIFPASLLVAAYRFIENPRILLTNYLLAALGGFLFFYAIVFLTKGRGMGFGDVKFSFLMGLLLGWPKIMVALWLAFVIGAIYASTLLFLQRKKISDTMPLGPFLVMGTFLAIFWGEKLWSLFLPI